MAIQTTLYPQRFRQEPIDLRGFDAWQDREGMVDASDLCRSMWGQFAPSWKATRKRDLAREPVPEFKKTVQFPPELVRCARAFGVLGVSGGVRLDERERRAWGAFRARVLQADPDVWSILWRYGSGEPVSLTADRFGVTVRYVLAVVALAVRWWRECWLQAQV